MQEDLLIATKLLNLKDSAEKRGIEFNISFNKLKKLWSIKRCHYTGIVFNDVPNDPHKRTVDRIDSSRGYVDDNIVACSNLSKTFTIL